MHLRDALITTKGAILAPGAIEFAPDPSGLFTCPPHDHLIIDLSWALYAKIIPATAVRDPATGYFEARPVGGYLALPAPLEFELRAGLVRNLSDPVTARADHAEGILSSSVDPMTEKQQKLGHCILAMVKTPEAVEFRIAAELRATRPFADWNTSAKNHWGEDGPAASLSARFTVNAATSYLALGAIDVSGSPVVERGVAPFDGHEGVMLERSVIETTGGLLGGSPGGETWRMHTGLDWRRGDREKHLWIKRTRLERRENGLFDARDHLHWAFHCTAFTLQTVMSLLRRGERLRLSASGGCPRGRPGGGGATTSKNAGSSPSSSPPLPLRAGWRSTSKRPPTGAGRPRGRRQPEYFSHCRARLCWCATPAIIPGFTIRPDRRVDVVSVVKKNADIE